jgi:hypothetical protein
MLAYKYVLKTLLLAFALLVSGIFDCKSQEVEMIHLQNKAEYQPGELLTLRFLLKNKSRKAIGALAILDLPNGWNQNLKSDVVRVPPNGTKLMLRSVSIPNGIYKRVYSIGVKIVSNGKLIAESKTDVSVGEKIDLDVAYQSQKEYCIAGDTVQGSFLIRNKGNCELNVNLQVNNCILMGNQRVNIPVDSTYKQPVMIPTSPEIKEYREKTIHMAVSIKNSEKRKIFSHGKLKVLPSGNVKTDPYERIPLEYQLYSLAYKKQGKWENGSMLEVSSSESVQLSKRTNLSFRFRGPNRFGKTVLGSPDQYWLGIQDSTFSISIGDQIFSASELTEYSRNGRGVQLYYQTGRLSFGGFYNKARFINEIEQEFSIYSTYSLNEESVLKISYLRKEEDKRQSDLYSVSGNSSLGKHLNIDSEISYGRFDQSHGVAFKLAGEYSLKKFRSYSKMMYASANYPGYYTNTIFLSGYFRYRLNQLSSWGLYYRWDDASSLKDTLSGILPSNKRINLRYDRRIGKNYSIAIQLTSNEREDRRVPKRFEYKEQKGTLTTRAKFGKIDLDISAEYGRYRNSLLNSEGNLLALEHQLNYNFKRGNMGYTISYERSEKNIEPDEQRFIFDLYGALNIQKHTQFTFEIRNAYRQEEYYRHRSIMDVSIKRNFKNHSSLEIFSNYSIEKNSLGNKDLAVGLRYRGTFNLPVKKKEKLGEIIGYLDSYSAEKIADVIVYLDGKVARTDEYGFFRFKYLKPGEYHLYLDKSTIAIDDIPISGLPVMVDVKPGTNKFRFGLTKAAKLIVKLKDASQEKSRTNVQNKHVWLELSNKLKQIKKKIKLDKDLIIDKLTPGVWKIRILRDDQQEGIHFPIKEKWISLKPGKTHTEQLKYSFIKKEIKFKSGKISL